MAVDKVAGTSESSRDFGRIDHSVPRTPRLEELDYTARD
jgi:hypothetical protein